LAEGTPVSDARTVLSIEDDDEVRTLARLVLEEAGFAVETARCAEDALDRLSGDAPIDLLLTDVVMPGMGGRAAARVAKEHRPETPVLFMSCFPAEIVFADGTTGALLSKPFTPAALLRQVRDLIAPRSDQ
jgi:CheY-like chemotaxis protein